MAVIELTNENVAAMAAMDTIRKKKLQNIRWRNRWECTAKKLYEEVLNNYQALAGELPVIPES